MTDPSGLEESEKTELELKREWIATNRKEIAQLPNDEREAKLNLYRKDLESAADRVNSILIEERQPRSPLSSMAQKLKSPHEEESPLWANSRSTVRWLVSRSVNRSRNSTDGLPCSITDSGQSLAEFVSVRFCLAI